jgi:hypothetical protein
MQEERGFPMVSFKCVLAALLLSSGAAVIGQELQQRPAQPQQVQTAPEKPEIINRPANLTLPERTTLQIESTGKYPMRAGATIEGRLLHPLYVDGRLAVPAGTRARGTVVSLKADKATRLHGRLNGDFTPFHIAEVRFDELMLAGGPVALQAGGVVTGAPVLRLSAPGTQPHQSLIGRQWDKAKSAAHQQIAFFTDPGLGGRATEMLYHQLPYHPEHIPVHTAWTIELSAPVTLPDAPGSEAAAPAPNSFPGRPEVWGVNAVLSEHLTSATAKSGDSVEAIVVEPVFNKDRQLVVPQGSTLIGRVTVARSARSFGRGGKLRFTFQQVKFPPGSELAGANRPVQGALSGATAQGDTGLSMDAEGTITPKSKSSVIAPLFLTMLAGRALDEDGSFTASAGVASNGFGLVGRIVGMTAGSRNLAAGLGYYAAALSAYENFLRPGHDVDFPKGTRIEIETTPLRAPVLQPDNPANGSSD